MISNKTYIGLFALFTLVYFRGLFSVVYGIDGSIYASISKTIFETNNWLELYLKGNDYLDKPPLHFWLSATSFKLFGVNSFAYKFPSFLFTILGAFSTYKLGKLLYSKEIGKLSALLFYSCFAIILINQDVRTDTILVGIVVYSIWQLIAYLKTEKYIHLIIGFIGIGLAMLTKGPIGLMVPVLALGTHFIIKKEWKNIFKWQWILGIVIIAIVLFPMVWGLYHQFDLQPTNYFTLSSGMEGTGTSGLKFYFWDQSFGRLTGGNKEWNNHSSKLFFTHTYLWSFLPWSILGIAGLFKQLKNSFKNIKTSEFYLVGAIILPFIAFSMSQFHLPHYIYVFFPFWMILTAKYIAEMNFNSFYSNILNKTQGVLSILFIGVSVLVVGYIFPDNASVNWVVIIVFSFLILYYILKRKGMWQMVVSSSLGILLIAFVFNFQFIPQITKYDGFSQAALFSKTLNVNNIYSNSEKSFIFDLHSNKTVILKGLEELKELQNNNNYVFIESKDLKFLQDNYSVKKVYTFKHYPITNIRLPFLNPKTRKNTMEEVCLVEI